MTAIIEVFTAPVFFVAAVVYLILTLSISLLEIKMHEALQEVSLSHWLALHFGFPLLYSLAMILFISLIYPELFGLANAPGLGALLESGEGRMHQMVNWAFIFALFIPMIPVIGPRLDIVLPVQGLVVVYLLGNWMSQYMGSPGISPIPSGEYFVPIIISGIVAVFLTILMTRSISERVETHYHLSQSEHVIYPILALLMHTPTLVFYARGLSAGENL